jgi:acetolactate synthase-1/2/3 large subunit
VDAGARGARRDDVAILEPQLCDPKGELANVGAGNPGRKALDMLDLSHPDLDWVGLARAMGVPGARVTTMEAFNDRFAEGIASPGPYLVEVVL